MHITIPEKNSLPAVNHPPPQKLNGRPLTGFFAAFSGGLSFEFRTFASHGILFYSANSPQTDFISCYLQDGKVTFGFNTGSGDIFLSTDNVVNDGTWKKVLLYRVYQKKVHSWKKFTKVRCARHLRKRSVSLCTLTFSGTSSTKII